MKAPVASLVCVVLFGCATTAPKLRFEDVDPSWKEPITQVAPVPLRPPEPASALAGPALPSLELQASLAGFAARARHLRSRTPRGEAISAGAMKNWLGLLAALDDFMQRPASRTSSHDLIRARITAEAELELDARQYGDFPAQLAEDVLLRVTQVAVRMAEVRRLKVQPGPAGKVRFAWPISPVAVTSLFGRRLHPITRTYRPHQGVDLAAEYGQQVFSAARGSVVRAAPNGAHGLQVEVQHLDGVTTRYSHLSDALVEVGDLVDQGMALGLAGNSGAATGPHLHFELWRHGAAQDPLEVLGEPALQRPPAVAASR